MDRDNNAREIQGREERDLFRSLYRQEERGESFVKKTESTTPTC